MKLGTDHDANLRDELVELAPKEAGVTGTAVCTCFLERRGQIQAFQTVQSSTQNSCLWFAFPTTIWTLNNLRSRVMGSANRGGCDKQQCNSKYCRNNSMSEIHFPSGCQTHPTSSSVPLAG